MAKRKSSHRSHARKHHSRPSHSVAKSAPVFVAPQTPPSIASESHGGFRKTLALLVVCAVIAALIYKCWPRGDNKTTSAAVAATTTVIPVGTTATPESLTLRQRILNFFRNPWYSVGSSIGFAAVILFIGFLIYRRLRKGGGDGGSREDEDQSAKPGIRDKATRKITNLFRRGRAKASGVIKETATKLEKVAKNGEGMAEAGLEKVRENATMELGRDNNNEGEGKKFTLDLSGGTVVDARGNLVAI